ncbi:MAG TPA: Stp1/IreP family PP2C-type Ser/Thr phosphatase [Pseudomonadales bacterium]|nr:Stp1/IreP family PP2C-type Ser/Thr phosphatase [Pseudomonadales bacterium]
MTDLQRGSTVAGLTHIGCVRRCNEDSIFLESDIDGHTLLAVVADGMGGHAGGAIASQLAVSEFERAWKYRMENVSLTGSWLYATAKLANHIIRSQAEADPTLKQMGTTLVSLLIEGHVAHIAHIGDSRCYLLKEGKLIQLTTDHSVVQQLVDSGSMTPDEAERSPIKNYLTRSLGSHAEPDMDVQRVELSGAERLLLCSDGLTNMLATVELENIMASCDSDQRVCERLVEEALARGASDNVSVIVCTLNQSGV